MVVVVSREDAFLTPTPSCGSTSATRRGKRFEWLMDASDAELARVGLAAIMVLVSMSVVVWIVCRHASSRCRKDRRRADAHLSKDYDAEAACHSPLPAKAGGA